MSPIFAQAEQIKVTLSPAQKSFLARNELNDLIWQPPVRVVHPYAWLGHIPLARVLVALQQPKTAVELGTHSGNSFVALCGAAQEAGLETKLFAVDTWEGDDHSGRYNEDVYDELSEYVLSRYGQHAQLLRTTFEEARETFADGSVDLLHIDGLHTYEAVLTDFTTWLPKLSESGVVLIHDIAVHERGFGVDRFWEEIRESYPHFAFEHSHGLGILLVGPQVRARVSEFVRLAQENPAPIRALFEAGSRAWLSDQALLYQQRFSAEVGGLTRPPVLDACLYLDFGEGFGEDARLLGRLVADGDSDLHRVVFGLRSDSQAVAVRLDPGESPVAIEDLQVWVTGASLDRQRLIPDQDNSFFSGEGVWMFSDDPWIELPLPPGADAVEVSCRVTAIEGGVVPLAARALAITTLELEQAQAELRVRRTESAKLWRDLGDKDRTIAEYERVAAKLEAEGASNSLKMAEADTYLRTLKSHRLHGLMHRLGLGVPDSLIEE